MPNHRAPILIADHEAQVRKVLSTLLDRTGYAIREASTGAEALEIAREETPAVAIVDVELAGMSGYEVCRALREEFGELLPIILVSGVRTEPLDRTAGLLIGADDYVVKPFDAEEMVARVRRSLVRSIILTSDVGMSKAEAFGLTPREHEVLSLLAGGLSQATIAKQLVISGRTVGTHIQRILAKLGVHSRAEAIAFAYRTGLMAEDETRALAAGE